MCALKETSGLMVGFYFKQIYTEYSYIFEGFIMWKNIVIMLFIFGNWDGLVLWGKLWIIIGVKNQVGMRC